MPDAVATDSGIANELVAALTAVGVAAKVFVSWFRKKKDSGQDHLHHKQIISMQRKLDRDILDIQHRSLSNQMDRLNGFLDSLKAILAASYRKTLDNAIASFKRGTKDDLLIYQMQRFADLEMVMYIAILDNSFNAVRTLFRDIFKNNGYADLPTNQWESWKEAKGMHITNTIRGHLIAHYPDNLTLVEIYKRFAEIDKEYDDLFKKFSAIMDLCQRDQRIMHEEIDSKVFAFRQQLIDDGLLQQKKEQEE